jgi:hypothetical protein
MATRSRDRQVRRAVVAQHDGERVEPRGRQPALDAGTAQLAAHADAQRTGVVRVGHRAVGAEVDGRAADVAERRRDRLPGAAVAGGHDERRHRPRLRA